MQSHYSFRVLGLATHTIITSPAPPTAWQGVDRGGLLMLHEMSLKNNVGQLSPNTAGWPLADTVMATALAVSTGGHMPE